MKKKLIVSLLLAYLMCTWFVVNPAHAQAPSASRQAGTTQSQAGEILKRNDNDVVDFGRGKIHVGTLRKAIAEARKTRKTIDAAKRVLPAEAMMSVRGGEVRKPPLNTARTAATVQPQPTNPRIGAMRQVGAIACEPGTPPLITKVAEGNLTPNDFIRVNGACLGAAMGTLRLRGAFPGNVLDLLVQEWADDHILAQVPPIGGVRDMPVRIQAVTASGVAAKLIDGNFVAQKIRFKVPYELTRNVVCGSFGDGAGQLSWCDNEVTDGNVKLHGGSHSYDHQLAFHDDWETRLPDGFALENLEIEQIGPGPITYDGGFDQGPANYAKFRVKYQQSCETRESDVLFASDPVVCSAHYFLRLWAWGPAGIYPAP